jgi:hypothetical protein
MQIMVKMEKSKIYLIVILVFSLASFLLILNNEKASKLGFDKDLFTIADPSAITKVVMDSKKGSVKLTLKDGNWLLADGQKADASMQNLLFNMMMSVQVKRPLSAKSVESVRENLKSEGVKVNFQMTDGLEKTFIAGGKAVQAISYFMDATTNEVYLMEIPGYNNYISAIFNLTPLQWRNRLIFATSWQSLKSLTVKASNAENPSLLVTNNGFFPSVAGLPNQKLDTGRLINYLQSFEYFETNEYIDISTLPRFDSLSKTTPMAEILLEDLDINNSASLLLYPALSNDKVQLVRDKNGDWSVLETRRIKNLFAIPENFEIVPPQ